MLQNNKDLEHGRHNSSEGENRTVSSLPLDGLLVHQRVIFRHSYTLVIKGTVMISCNFPRAHHCDLNHGSRAASDTQASVSGKNEERKKISVFP